MFWFQYVFIADFKLEFVCWERYRITNDVVWIFEINYLANKYLLKVSKRNSKTRCEIGEVNNRDYISLLTTCNMSLVTFFSCFFGVLWTWLCLLWYFYFYEFFLDIFIASFKCISSFDVLSLFPPLNLY